MDQVEGRGDFVEIAMQCEEGSITRQAIARLSDLAAGFAARQVRMGYVDFRWKEEGLCRASARGLCGFQVEGRGDSVEIAMQCEEGSITRQAIARLSDLAAGFAARQPRGRSIGTSRHVRLWMHPRVYRAAPNLRSVGMRVQENSVMME